MKLEEIAVRNSLGEVAKLAAITGMPMENFADLLGETWVLALAALKMVHGIDETVKFAAARSKFEQHLALMRNAARP